MVPKVFASLNLILNGTGICFVPSALGEKYTLPGISKLLAKRLTRLFAELASIFQETVIGSKISVGA